MNFIISYRDKMSQRSLKFRDRVLPPLEEALWWCEYAIRHKGTPHLRSQAKNMAPLVLFMWDILLIWLTGFVFAILGLAYAIKKVFVVEPKPTPRYSSLLRIKKTE